MTGLTKLERAVLDHLLAGDDPVLVALREQARQATIAARELSGAGFFLTFKVPTAVASAPGVGDTHFGDVIATVPGLRAGAGFVLFLKAGKLDMLEGYTFDEPWPARIDDFALSYTKSPRDLTSLAR